MRRIKSHTYRKLAYFEKYIKAYLVATKRMPVKYYIDAFSGTGRCILCDRQCKSKGGKKCDGCKMGTIVDGSALIALKAPGIFSGYLFVELNKRNCAELTKNIEVISSANNINIKIRCSNSNILLQQVGSIFNIDQHSGCFVLLDPEGPELHWDTLRSLKKNIQRVEFFVLYPYDMALARLVPNYKEKLDDFYGDSKWLKIHQDSNTKDTRRTNLLEFYKANLRLLGFNHVIHKLIRRNHRDGKPLYFLILATNNDIASKIITSVFDKELDGQGKLKL